MKYVNTESQLDTLARKLAERLKVPVTRVKSAIANAEGFEHISALNAAFSTTPSPSEKEPVRVNRSHVMTQFVLWLEDNVDMGTDIHFDNEGEVNSENVLAEINMLNANTSVFQSLMVEFDTWWLAQTSRPDLLAASQKESVGYDSDGEFYEGVEGAITDVAMSLSSEPQLTKALAVLQLHGLDDIAGKLKELAIDGVVFKQLN
jgi:hypothetical protein